MSKIISPIVFLHLPKTAGQSVRSYLEGNFPRRKLFPGQLDSHLFEYSLLQMQKYEIFSGHFSFSLLSHFCNPFVFTILRDPISRLVSYYLYLRSEISKKAAKGYSLDAVENSIFNLSFDELFSDDTSEAANYCKNLFDNFYMYYFSTRMMLGRSAIVVREDDYFMKEKLTNVALRNIESHINVFSIDSLSVFTSRLELFQDFKKIIELPEKNVATIQNKHDPYETIKKYSKDYGRSQELLHLMCQFDYKIYANFFG